MTKEKIQIALVTGSSRGIGKAVAQALANNKYLVYINYMSDRQAADKTLDEIRTNGGQARLLQFDVTDTASCENAVKEIITENKKIDVLVNNAGIRNDRLLAMMKKDAWQQIIDTNLNSFFNMTKPVVKQMLKNRYGRIINMASTAGQIGNAGQVNYCASKAGLIGATKALAREIANRNITVNAVSPGFIETQMTENIDIDEIVKSIPAGRLGKPEEVAAAIVFLCSNDASYINGQVIGVNGGII
ncbi:MAG: 3-oxoacyl-ACP reductase FabG [Desulfobacteraceae bacterium]|nr:3-oxoacyl-ACP reductase FabG [Desulfobacteraceae bacterium]